jgi:hypothetical protein
MKVMEARARPGALSFITFVTYITSITSHSPMPLHLMRAIGRLQSLDFLRCQFER